MYKRPITFRNLDGERITKDFYFNLTVPEVTELEYGMTGKLSEQWTQIVETKNAGAMLREFKNLISMAYGERSSDGITFLKEDPITGASLGRKFLQSDAYAVLFMELLGENSSDHAFTDFLRACLPTEVSEKLPSNIELPSITEARSTAAAERDKPEQFSRDELLAMSEEEFDRIAGKNPSAWSREVMQVAFERKGNNMRTSDMAAAPTEA